MRTTLLILSCAAPALAGCAAVTSTTNTVARGLEQTTAATSQSSDAATGAEYADARRFVDSQFALVRRDAAAGGGEHTAALARLMGESDGEAFGRWMQRHYRQLFANLTSRADLVARIAAYRNPPMQPGSSTDA